MTYPTFIVETFYRDNSNYPRFRCFQCERLLCRWCDPVCYLCRKGKA